MKSSDVLGLVIAAAGVLVSMVGLIFVGVQVRRAAAASRRAAVEQELERERLRRKETIEAVTATSQHREKLKGALPWNDRDSVRVKAFLEKIEGNKRAWLPCEPTWTTWRCWL